MIMGTKEEDKNDNIFEFNNHVINNDDDFFESSIFHDAIGVAIISNVNNNTVSTKQTSQEQYKSVRTPKGN